jgi:hypothetical protein
MTTRAVSVPSSDESIRAVYGRRGEADAALSDLQARRFRGEPIKDEYLAVARQRLEACRQEAAIATERQRAAQRAESRAALARLAPAYQVKARELAAAVRQVHALNGDLLALWLAADQEAGGDGLQWPPPAGRVSVLPPNGWPGPDQVRFSPTAPALSFWAEALERECR